MANPQSNRRLNIPSSNHSIVFRRIEAVIREDPTCSRVFASRVRAWNGSTLDAAQWGVNLTPGIKLTPSQSGDEWYGPSGFTTKLSIDCEVAVAGTNIEDVFDLVQVVRRAFYPTGNDSTGKRKSQVIHDAIKGPNVTDGPNLCETGEPVFGSPGVSLISEPDAISVARFSIAIEVQDTINP